MKKEESKEFLGTTEEERKEALAKDIAGLGEKIFICKKKDFDDPSFQPYIDKDGNLVTEVKKRQNENGMGTQRESDWQYVAGNDTC